ncbi:11117_t:CDS:2, partial [Acaulospora morrowiae]
MSELIQEEINRGHIYPIEYNSFSNFKEISTGQHDKVFCAYCEDLRRAVTLKTMYIDLSLGPDGLEREIQFMKSVKSHENFIQCF